MDTIATSDAEDPAQRDAVGNRFELVTRALNVAYYEWIPGRDALHVSPVLAELLGGASGSWTQQRAGEAIHSDDRPGFRAARIAYLKGNADRAEFTYRAKTASGEWRWLRDQTTVERDDSGRVTRLVGAVSDITEANQREALIRDLIARQTASVEVLKAISASPDDPRTVFRLIARRAAELCNAVAAVVCEYDGDQVHMRAVEGYDPALSDRLVQAFPRPAGPETIAGRVVLSGRNAHVRDVSADAELYPLANDLGVGTLLGVPLHRDGNAIGVIIVARSEPGGFDDTQVALIESFAEQAVIAIVSTTTLRELHKRTMELAARNTEDGERIEQQAATIDVLKVMSASPGDVQPVFELIAERARTFCEADKVAVGLLDGEMLHLQAHTTLNDAFDRDYAAQFPRPLDASSVFGRAILARDAVQSPDLHADPEHLSAQMRALDIRSIVGVPIMRAGTPIGAIALARIEPGTFSTIQMELLRTFAEQAVIAIGSAETYRALQDRTAALALRNSEYGERIEHQSATIDVLKAMSASPGDTQPVFDLIVRRAQELCNGMSVGLFEYDGALMHIRAAFGGNESASERFAAMFPMAPTRQSLACRAVIDRQIVHVRDMDAEQGLFQAVRDMGAPYRCRCSAMARRSVPFR
jgi:PAS domain S-box-containing protein